MVLILIIHFVYDVGCFLVFPSPYGDYGSYLDGINKDGLKVEFKFPSPYGDYGSYLRKVTIERMVLC